MKAKELRDLTSEELMSKLNDFKSELISYWSIRKYSKNKNG